MAERLALNRGATAAPARQIGDFEGWVAAEQPRILLLCRHLLQDWDEAANASQDAFLKAFQAWRKDGLESIEEPAKWMARVAVNTCLDRLKSRRWQFWRRRPNPGDEMAILAFARDPEPDAESRVLARQIEQRLVAALKRLSLRQRAVFTLKHFEDRSMEEIAEILELDLGTVKAHLSRALAKLRKELRELYVARGASG